MTTAASSQPDTASAGHRPAAAVPAAATATTASPRPLPAGSSGTGSTARMPASRVKNPRTRPAEERNRRSLSRTVSCGTPLAAAIDRNPWPRAARASMSPITAVPSHRRASTHAGSSTRDPARAAPRPPRPHPHRDPPRREHPPQDRVAPPAQPAPAAGTRKQAVTQKLLRNRRAVAYREQRCLQAPHGPPRTSGKR